MTQNLWINGEFIATENYQSLLSPFTEGEIEQVAIGKEQHVQAAIKAAEAAFATYKKMPAHQRADILDQVARLLSDDKEDCARLISQESAKPYTDALAEVERTIMTYTFAAGEARRMYGQSIPMDAAPGGENRVAYTKKEPLGVIGAITPFNFPMNLVAHKVGPALAAGNSVVLKPASQTPLSAYKIAGYFHQAGLPSGVLNVVTGKGSEIGKALTENETVKMITFTGSPSVGKMIRQNAGLKKVTLELGSNSAVIVDKDTNLAEHMPRIVKGAFAYQGQVCISVQRIFVEETIYEEFVESFRKHTQSLILGNPLEKDTDVSSMISKDELERAQEWIEEALRAGGKLLCGGELEQGMLQPTAMLHVPEDVKIFCEEAFAPVVMINPFNDFEDAIREVNHSQYGLQAGVFTQNVQKAFYAAEELEVGGVMINDIPTFRVDHMPYGGVKESGMGREGIQYAMEEMTEIKLISFKL
ncbi:aldehyde dehydrogenase family protein [Bacillus sp. 2205SS5-2]|uniref:aldehyde dehydrogenase family protein n=1 Tax=Bacillus sp. 2205SS5-2 TaxID=3109031 RepID=UPI0030066062